MIDNSFKVSKSQWKKWTSLQKLVFNEVYSTMTYLDNKRLFLHPGQDAPRDEYWTTTAWNAAWTAADAARSDNVNFVEV